MTIANAEGRVADTLRAIGYQLTWYRIPELSGALVDADGEPTSTPAVVSSAVMFGHDIDASGARVPRYLSMMELGFVPTFYQFVNTTIEITLSVRLTGSGLNRNRFAHQQVNMNLGSQGLVVQASTVDAGFSASYGYSADMATRVSTRIVPIPPPAALDQHIARLSADPRLNANTATLEELSVLDALGPERAAALVRERGNGPFLSYDDLQGGVAGIGAKTIAQLREVLHV